MNNAPGQRVCLSMCRCTHAQVKLRIVELQNRRKTIKSLVTAVFSHGRLDVISSVNGAVQCIFNSK